MISCPEPSCQYKTNRSANMHKHVVKTRHGRSGRTKQFKGHLQSRKSKKDRKKS